MNTFNSSLVADIRLFAWTASYMTGTFFIALDLIWIQNGSDKCTQESPSYLLPAEWDQRSLLLLCQPHLEPVSSLYYKSIFVLFILKAPVQMHAPLGYSLLVSLFRKEELPLLMISTRKWSGTDILQKETSQKVHIFLLIVTYLNYSSMARHFQQTFLLQILPFPHILFWEIRSSFRRISFKV